MLHANSSPRFAASLSLRNGCDSSPKNLFAEGNTAGRHTPDDADGLGRSGAVRIERTPYKPLAAVYRGIN